MQGDQFKQQEQKTDTFCRCFVAYAQCNTATK